MIGSQFRSANSRLRSLSRAASAAAFVFPVQLASPLATLCGVPAMFNPPGSCSACEITPKRDVVGGRGSGGAVAIFGAVPIVFSCNCTPNTAATLVDDQPLATALTARARRYGWLLCNHPDRFQDGQSDHLCRVFELDTPIKTGCLPGQRLIDVAAPLPVQGAAWRGLVERWPQQLNCLKQSDCRSDIAHPVP